MHGGIASASGALGLQVTHVSDKWWPRRELSLSEIRCYGLPHRDLPTSVNEWRQRNRVNLWRGARRVMLARGLRLPHYYGQLFLTKHTRDHQTIYLGLASLRVVTTVGVKFICDNFNNGAQDVATMKYHGFGTDNTAEAAADTALGAEVTNTTYVGDVRPTGSQASATDSPNATYTTVGTYSPDSGTPLAIVEHGIFSANASGTLLDRSVFATVTLDSGDSLESTYVLTVNSGG